LTSYREIVFQLGQN